MQPLMRVRLLGRLDIRLGDEALPPLDSARAESLLAFLLLHREAAQSRERLAFLLWPESTEAQARTNLRHVLHTLRHRLPDAGQRLEITPRTLRWRHDPASWLDVAEFERLLERDKPTTALSGTCAGAGEGRRNALRQAVDLYGGDLLEGCYDEWLLEERERLRHRHLVALAELAELCEASGDVDEAISHAERLLRGDPLREQTYRHLMRLHNARGDRARALRVYHLCNSTLERELGVEPSAETRAVYEALMARTPDAPPAAVATASPALVGRGPDRAALGAAWRAAGSGQGRLVLVHGEPGIGKTRLVDDFAAWCARRGAATATARCYAAEGPLAYGPVVAWLRSDALRPRLHRIGRARLTELARLLPELLAEIPDLPRPEPLPESDQRHRLFDAVCAAVSAAPPPLLLTVDDLQHADRETCQFLHYLLRTHPGTGLLVVGTARREEVDADHPVHHLVTGLQATDRLVDIELTALGRDETALLAQRLTGAPLSDSHVQRLYAETEGNPLFVVEALRAGWTAGGALSRRVQSVIEARLGQLSESARELVGAAAVVGRAFSTDVLAAASEASEDAFVRSLDELWRRRIVREQPGGVHGGTYDFSHDKIREVAYLGVSPARRRRLHLRIAAALEHLHGASSGPVSAQVAGHYELAGAVEPAIGWYRRAAEAAQLLHADAQAADLLNRALQLLLRLPASTDRAAVELELRTALLAPLVSVQGYGSRAISQTHARARELARQIGVDLPPPLLRSLALHALTGADFQEATRFGHLLRSAGEGGGNAALVVEAAYVLGVAAFWQADFTEARRQLELAVDRYRVDDSRAHLMRFGQDPKVVCLSRLGNTLLFLGRPDEARAARSAALAWADRIEHPYSRQVALVFSTLLALDLGDERDLRRYSAALTAAAPEGRQVQLPEAAFRGYVAVLDGQTDDGLAQIRRAIQQSAAEPSAPGVHAVLGRTLIAACLASGRVADAVEAADRLLAMGGAACVWEAEARRVRGAFLAPST